MRTASFKIALFVLAGLLVALAPVAAQQPQTLQITNGPVVEGVGDTWAVVAWTTNTGGSTVVHYGTDQNNLSQTAQAPWTKDSSGGSTSTTHRVHVEGLNPNTTYYFAVDSGEGSGTGTQAKSNVASFTTKASGSDSGSQGNAPEAVRIIHGPVVESVGPTSAVIAWTTNTGASTVVRYGTDQNNLDQTAKEAWTKGADPSRTTHRVHVENLKPNTTYYFAVVSGEASGTGTEAKSNVSSFTTKSQ